MNLRALFERLVAPGPRTPPAPPPVVPARTTAEQLPWHQWPASVLRSSLLAELPMLDQLDTPWHPILDIDPEHFRLARLVSERLRERAIRLAANQQPLRVIVHQIQHYQNAAHQRRIDLELAFVDSTGSTLRTLAVTHIDLCGAAEQTPTTAIHRAAGTG